MRRFSIGIVVSLITGLLVATASLSWAGSPIKLLIDGQEIKSDVAPQVIDGRVMVPARFIAEPLGAVVEWDAAANAIVITSTTEDANVSAPVLDPPTTPETWVTLDHLQNAGVSVEITNTDQYSSQGLDKGACLYYDDLEIKFPVGYPDGTVIHTTLGNLAFRQNGVGIMIKYEHGAPLLRQSDLRDLGILL